MSSEVGLEVLLGLKLCSTVGESIIRAWRKVVEDLIIPPYKVGN